jgi:hypothetical protein
MAIIDSVVLVAIVRPNPSKAAVIYVRKINK